MRPLLVILLVLAAVAALVTALKSSGKGSTQPIESHRPAGVEKQAPPTMSSLEQGGVGRADATSELVNSPEAARETRELHPSALRGNRLRGRVESSEGNGVAGAEVILTRYGPADFFLPTGDDRIPDRKTTSDEAGRFSFADVTPDVDYTIVAFHPRFGRRTESYLSVAEGETSDEIRVVLEAGSVVRGVVSDEGGAGLGGVSVRLGLLTLGDLEEGAGVMRTTSDADGTYQFQNVSRGQYTLTFEKEGFGKTQLARVEVDGTSETVRDVSLEVAYLVTGDVRDQFSGSPVEGARVEAYSTDRREAMTNTATETDAEGHFELTDLRQGNYTLLVRAPGYATLHEARVPTGSMSLELELSPLPRVSGVVLDPSGTPLHDFVVRLRQPVTGTEQTVPVPATKTEVEGSADGSFSLPCPRAGEFRVEALHPGFAATVSEPFSVEKGNGVSGVVVRMGSGGTLKGVVRDANGAPIGGASVQTHHTDYVDEPFYRSLGEGYPSAATRASGRTDAEGAFRMTHLTPETYQITVTHPDYAPLTLRGLVVTEGSEVEVPPLTLSAGATLSGTVFGPAGSGLAGALVQISLDTEATGAEFGAFYKTRANAEGRYSFQHLPPGQYKLSVQRQTSPDNPFVGMGDMNASRRSILLADGRSYTQDFTLSN